MQCFACFCVETGSRGITFYRFPNGRRDCKAWLQALGRQGCSVPRDAVVCSQHFLAEDFYVTRQGAKKLQPGVVPFVITDDVGASGVADKHRDREMGLLRPVPYKIDIKSEGVNSMIEDNSNVVFKQEFTDKCTDIHNSMIEDNSNVVFKQEFTEKCTDTDINNALNGREQLKQEMCNDEMILSSNEHVRVSFLSRNKNDLSTPTISNDLYLKENTVSVINRRECKGSNGINLASIKLKTLVIALERCDETLRRRMTERVAAKTLNSSLNKPSTCSNVVFKQEFPEKCTDTDNINALNGREQIKQEMYNDEMIHSSKEDVRVSFLSRNKNDLSSPNRRECKGSNGINLASLKLKTLVITLERCDKALRRRMTEPVAAKTLNSPHNKPRMSLDAKNPSNQHISSKAKRTFICHICNHHCHTRTGFVYHLETHTGNKRFACEICEYKCIGKSTLVRHMLSHNGEKKFSCPYCTKKFVLKNYLEVHIRSHTRELPYSCELCDYRCNAKPSLRIHKQSRHSGTRKFSCDICAKDFALRQYLVEHIRNHAEKRYLCDKCPFKTGSIGTLLTHKIIHTGLKKHVCNVCKHKFSTSYGLNRHMRTHTGDKPFSCAHCDRKFARRCTLVDHMRVHTGEKPYTCTVCEKKFSQGSSLHLHMRIHNHEKKFECKVCHSFYQRKSYLKIHMKYHTGEKPYKCEVCGLKSATSSYLNLHMRVHTGEKPFKCNDCDYKCTTARTLLLHTRTHTGEKPYTCGKCKGRFATSSSLAAHSRRIHKPTD